MSRKRIRNLILLALLLAAGYWVYDRLNPIDPDSIPPKVAEESAELRLKALHSITAEMASRGESESESVEIQHLLLMFDKTIQDLPEGEVARTRAEAEQLAADLFSQARAGEDFDDLVTEFSDDSPPGIFLLVTDPGSFDPDLAADAIGREEFVPAIGDLSWRLKKGEVGVATYDPVRCFLGWHLVKRLR